MKQFRCAEILFTSWVILHSHFSIASETSHVNWFNNPQLQTELDEQTQSKGYTGNKINLLINGVQSFAQRKANTAEADVILIKTLEFWDDEPSALALLQILKQRAQAGAKIFIQFDVKGTRHTPKEQYDILYGTISPIPKNLQKLMDEGRGNVFIIPTTIPESYSDFLKATFGIYAPWDHEKYWITWNSKNPAAPVKVIMGGMNTGDQYFLGQTKNALGKYIKLPKYQNTYAFRDTDVEVIGPVTRDIIETYIKRIQFHMLNKNVYFRNHLLPLCNQALVQLEGIQKEMISKNTVTFPPQAGGALARLITNASHHITDDSPHNIQKAFSLLINTIPTGKTIKLTSACYYPTAVIEKDIISAANRGVKFDILVNAADTTDPEMGELAITASCRYKYIVENSPPNSIQFYSWHTSNPSMGVSSIHQKVLSFGNDMEDPFIVGSSNLDSASLLRTSENILLIQDPILKKQFDVMFTNDFNQPNVTKLTDQEIKNIHWYNHFPACLKQIMESWF